MSSQSAVNKFKDWVSERVNHPLGVLLGVSAVKELEKENEILEPLVMEKQRAIQSLISENASLKEALQGALSIKNLWLPAGSFSDNPPENHQEIEALHLMANTFEKLLNKSESNHGN